MQFIEVPECIQIRNERLIIRKAFEEVSFNKKKSDAQIENETNLLSNSPSGHVNRKVRLQMNKILSNWLLSVNMHNKVNKYKKDYQFTFVTLTLPSKQMHSDKEINRSCLDRFLITVKRKYKVVNYLWRAERQKNGNIHYHIIIDKKIHWYDIQTNWNNIIKPLGYIDSYRINQKAFHSNGFKIRFECVKYWSIDNQKKAYLKGMKENWNSPNSTDIHKLKGLNNAISYVMKYVSKSALVDELDSVEMLYSCGNLSLMDYKIKKDILLQKIDKDKINSRVWGCSDKIKNINDPKIMLDYDSSILVDNLIQDKNSKVIQKDEIVIIYNKKLMEYVSRFDSIYKTVNDHYLYNYSYLYDDSFREEKFVLTPSILDNNYFAKCGVKQPEFIFS